MTNQSGRVEEKMLNLVLKLHAKTKEGQIKWERTASSNIFQYAFPSYVVRISVKQGDADAPDYYITVKDSDGTTIESASDVSIGRAFPNAKVFATMEELFTLARREALGVDQALDSLLSELE